MCALGQFFKYNVYHTLQSLLKNERKIKKITTATQIDSNNKLGVLSPVDFSRQMGMPVRLSHRRRMEKEAKTNRRRCFLGENCRTHASIQTV